MESLRATGVHSGTGAPLPHPHGAPSEEGASSHTVKDGLSGPSHGDPTQAPIRASASASASSSAAPQPVATAQAAGERHPLGPMGLKGLIVGAPGAKLKAEMLAKQRPAHPPLVPAQQHPQPTSAAKLVSEIQPQHALQQPTMPSSQQRPPQHHAAPVARQQIKPSQQHAGAAGRKQATTSHSPPIASGQKLYATAPTTYPTTFDILGTVPHGKVCRPEDLQGLRSTRRSLKVCSSPEEMVADIDHLTYISRGATSLVFHGIWQGQDVAVKFLMASFSDHSASVREALLGAEVSHPNVVHCFITRCCKLTADFLVGQLDGITLEDSHKALASTAPASLPKSMYRNKFESLDGFGPPPSSKLMDELAEESAKPSATGRPTPKTGRSPWGGTLTWGHVLTIMRASAGYVLTMIVAEYCDVGTMSNAIHDMRVFDMTGADVRSSRYRLALRALLRTAREATLGLHHLHQAGVIHGDIKPGNVLLISTRTDRRGFIAKLTDLGAARVQPQAQLSTQTKIEVAKLTPIKDVDWGTTPYMAPEHFAGFLVPASDIFSLGVTLWEMCHAARPYEQFTHAVVSQGVVSGKLRLNWTASVPAALIDLVAKCMLHSPAKRPTTSQVIIKLAAIEAQIRMDLRKARSMPTLQPLPAVAVLPPPPGHGALASQDMAGLEAAMQGGPPQVLAQLLAYQKVSKDRVEALKSSYNKSLNGIAPQPGSSTSLESLHRLNLLARLQSTVDQAEELIKQLMGGPKEPPVQGQGQGPAAVSANQQQPPARAAWAESVQPGPGRHQTLCSAPSPDLLPIRQPLPGRLPTHPQLVDQGQAQAQVQAQPMGPQPMEARTQGILQQLDTFATPIVPLATIVQGQQRVQVSTEDAPITAGANPPMAPAAQAEETVKSKTPSASPQASVL